MALFNAVDIAHRSMDYHMRRHNVLASNVANLDTPGFRPMELVRDTREVSGAAQLTRTSAAHLRPVMLDGSVEGTAQERVVQPGGDGNAVSLEREMSKVAANDLRYETVGRIVRHQLGMLRYAAGDGT